MLYSSNTCFVSFKITPKSSANSFVKSTSLLISLKKSNLGPSLQCPFYHRGHSAAASCQPTFCSSPRSSIASLCVVPIAGQWCLLQVSGAHCKQVRPIAILWSQFGAHCPGAACLTWLEAQTQSLMRYIWTCTSTYRYRGL